MKPDLHFQVIGHGDGLVAFVKIVPVHVPVDNPAPDAMEIWQIYVRKYFIGEGFGSQLMDWAEEQFAPRKTSVDHAEASCCFVKFKGVASVLRKRRFLNSDP
jgi:ribosomal protein S18 acetylase RimI-like enzyme